MNGLTPGGALGVMLSAAEELIRSEGEEVNKHTIAGAFEVFGDPMVSEHQDFADWLYELSERPASAAAYAAWREASVPEIPKKGETTDG